MAWGGPAVWLLRERHDCLVDPVADTLDRDDWVVVAPAAHVAALIAV